jgi:deazaflavin-dependent oxidoreductase (nitroreductase family)
MSPDRSVDRRAIDRELGEQLAAWGKVATLQTRGRTSGSAVRAAVGYVEEPDRSVLVAAGGPDTHWALNLLADPSAILTIGERTIPVVAEPLERADHAHAIRELVLKYGTPAESLGVGPSFRLRPVSPAPPFGPDPDASA